MDNKLEYRSIEGLLKLLRNKMLTANPEYQRGEVWSESQKKNSSIPCCVGTLCQ